MRMKSFALLIALGMALSLSHRALCQRFGSITDPRPKWRDTDWTWTREPWTGQDAPFRAVSLAIYNRIQAGTPAVSMITEYEIPAMHAPKDALKQFAWAFLMWRVALHQPLAPRVQGSVDASMAALHHVPSPRAYLFDRLRFILDCCHDQRDAPLIEIGERLLKRHPDDGSVRRCFESLLAVNRDRNLQARARKMLEEDIARCPADAGVLHAGLADIAFQNYLHDKKPEDARAAIAEFRQYLRLAAPDNYSRPRAEQYIKELTEALRTNGQSMRMKPRARPRS